MAVTRFEGMAGFRNVDKTAEILGLLGTPWAEATARRLMSTPAFQALRAVVTEILGMEPAALARALSDIRVAAEAAEERSHQLRRAATRLNVDRGAVDREAVRVFAQTIALADRYPEDPGVLVTLLLNHVVLAPGEAMFLGAGVVHAYTSGFGIEVQAGVACFDPPVDEFALVVGATPLAGIADDGPRIVLALDGPVTVTAGGTTEHLEQGAAAFVPHAAGPLRIDGDGRVAIGVVPA